MGKVRILQSTGNEEEDAKLLAELKDSLVNKFSLEEAKERERQANLATGSDQSGNALTDQPRIKGQVLAVLVEDEDAKPLEARDAINGKKVFIKNGTVQGNDNADNKPAIIELETKPVEVVK